MCYSGDEFIVCWIDDWLCIRRSDWEKVSKWLRVKGNRIRQRLSRTNRNQTTWKHHTRIVTKRMRVLLKVMMMGIYKQFTHLKWFCLRSSIELCHAKILQKCGSAVIEGFAETDLPLNQKCRIREVSRHLVYRLFNQLALTNVYILIQITEFPSLRYQNETAFMS